MEQETYDRQDLDNEILLDLPGTYKYLSVVGVCIGAMLERVDHLEDLDRTIYQVKLAVHEACTNIVDHAYSELYGRILAVITISGVPKRIIVDLHDTGRPFLNLDQQQREIEAGTNERFGLFLINELLDSVFYYSEAGKNYWRLIKNLKSLSGSGEGCDDENINGR